MKPIPWERKPKLFYCPACRRFLDDSGVTGDQVHDRTRGGCGEFCLDAAAEIEPERRK